MSATPDPPCETGPAAGPISPADTSIVGTSTATDELAHLRERAAGADPAAALAVLDAVPDVPPDPRDRFADDVRGETRRE